MDSDDSTTTGRTSYSTVLGGLYYSPLPSHRVEPRIGAVLGYFTPASPTLRSANGLDDREYVFTQRVTKGYAVGFDVRLGGGGWILSFDVKSVDLAYRVEANVDVDTQTLLDQRVRDAMNHLTFSLGRRW